MSAPLALLVLAVAACAPPPPVGVTSTPPVQPRPPLPTNAAGLPSNPTTGAWYSDEGVALAAFIGPQKMKIWLRYPALRFRRFAGQGDDSGVFIALPVTIEPVEQTAPVFLQASSCTLRDQASGSIEPARVDKAFVAALNQALGVQETFLPVGSPAVTGVFVYRATGSPIGLTLDCSSHYKGPVLQYPPERIFDWTPR